MPKILFSYSLFMLLTGCSQSSSQGKKEPASQLKVGGLCEGCEAIYESKVPFKALNEIDTLPDFDEPGPKLVISGTVYKSDGKTPAPGVVLYVYHTNQTGKYPVSETDTGWGRRHGSIRGWIKTNSMGRYKFYTLRPASYSKQGPPAHIHITIKEPGKSEYWIDDFHFADDPFLTTDDRKKFQNRGGNGVMQLEKRAGVFYGERAIYLGKAVTDYPKAKALVQPVITIGLLAFKQGVGGAIIAVQNCYVTAADV